MGSGARAGKAKVASGLRQKGFQKRKRTRRQPALVRETGSRLQWSLVMNLLLHPTAARWDKWNPFLSVDRLSGSYLSRHRESSQPTILRTIYPRTGKWLEGRRWGVWLDVEIWL